jgi:hypothetical protein
MIVMYAALQVLEPADKPTKQPRLVTPLRIKVEGRKEPYETYEDLDEIVARWAENTIHCFWVSCNFAVGEKRPDCDCWR